MDLSSEPGLVAFLGRWGLGGLAAGLVSGGWLGRRLSELTAEDLADLGVPRAVRGEVLAALRAAVAEELAATLGEWMTPLAHAASGYLREEHPRLRLWSACDVVEMSLRLIVIIGLAQVRRAHGGRLPRERLARVFEHIRTPTLSHWRAMALETCKALEEDGTAECRELGALLAPVARVLSDLVGHGGDAETSSLLRLRNMLAHGSVSTSLARDLAERWRTRIDDALGKLEPLASLPLLARTADGQVLRIAGEAGTVETVPEIDPAAVGTRAGAAAIGLADRVLPLAPFVLRGVPRVGEVRGSREVPQIFLRRSEIVLEYMALGAEDAAFGQGDDEHLQDFERLFETPRAASERRFQIPGFERELRRDADQFLGRAGELEALWTCATGSQPAGLYWLYGPPGIGKSILMARLMADLIDEAEERRARGSGEPWLVLAYRFCTGHESCRASTFLGFLRERLGEVVGDPETGTAIRGLDDLQAVLKLLPLAAQQMRVLVPLDGLDEIAAAEPNFLSLDLASLVDAGGLWLCAGRPEGRLPEFMRRHGAKEVLPGGLGGMETTAIRAMILEKTGPLGRKLLAGDRDGGDGQSVVNAFVEAVARKADGLPLYVRYVIGDILGNRLRFLDGREAEGLPPSLTAYYEELVQRCAVGDDHVLATYALCLLALAYETLSEAAIADLLGRRLTLDGDGEAQRAKVRAALGRLGGMLTRGFTPEGEIGFRIYHESLREHLQHAPDLAITRRDTIDNILCKGAQEPGQGPAAHYLYRAGVRHLIAFDQTLVAASQLADFEYLMARLRALTTEDAGAVLNLASDWARVDRSLREGGLELNQRQRYARRFIRKRQHLLMSGSGSIPAYRLLLELALDDVNNSEFQAAASAYSNREVANYPIIRSVIDGYVDTADNSEVVLYGHSGTVFGALPVNDDSLLSWSNKEIIIRTWDTDGRPTGSWEGHTGNIKGVTALPGNRFLSWSTDATLRIWNAEGQTLAVLSGHRDWINGAHMLSHSNRLLSWADDGEMRLWDQAGQLINAFREKADWAIRGALEFADGRIISWSGSHTIHLWDTGGHLLNTLAAPSADAYPSANVRGAIVLSGNRILSWSDDAALRIWSEQGSLEHTLVGHSSPLDGALELENGNILSWSMHENSLRLWDHTGQPVGELSGHEAPVMGAVVLGKGRFLSWAGDGALRLWQQDSFKSHILEGHSSLINGAKELSNDHLLSWSHDGTIRIWSPEGLAQGVFEGHSGSVRGCLELAGGRVLSWADDHTLRIWEQHLASADLSRRRRSPVMGIRSWSDERLVSWSIDALLVWDRDASTHVPLVPDMPSVSGALTLQAGSLVSWSGNDLYIWNNRLELSGRLEGHSSWVRGATALSDGGVLSWSEDGTVRTWGANGCPRRTFTGHTSFVCGATQLSNGQFLSWSDDGTLRRWDESASEKEIYVSSGHSGRIEGALVLPNGRILSWSADATLRLWDETGSPLSTFTSHSARVNGALLLSDGSFLSWSTDATLRRWDDEGHLLQVYQGHSDSVTDVFLLPKGHFLSCSQNRAHREIACRVWDIEGGASEEFLGARQPLRDFMLVSQSRMLSWTTEGLLLLWDTRTGSLRLIAAYTFGTDITVCTEVSQNRVAIGLSNGAVVLLLLPQLTEAEDHYIEVAPGRDIRQSAQQKLSFDNADQAVSMNIGLVVNARGKLCLVHDQPFAEKPLWIGYHIDKREIEIIFRDGSTFPIEWDASKELHEAMLQINKILVIRMENGQPVEGFDTSFLRLYEGRTVS